MTSMLNWYRYILRYKAFHPQPVKTITCPVLALFGTGDIAINQEIAELGSKLPFSSNGKFVPYEGISHWIQHQVPDRVNQDVLTFIKEK